MTDRGRTPHDALFRHVFSQPEHAAAELRHALPEPIVAAIDWATLRVVSGTWVDAELRSTHADLLWSVQLAGHETLVYVRLEHKSGPDAMTPLQLLRYMIRIWQTYRREHPGIRTLPVVLPVVVHHGDDGWKAPTDLLHLFDLPPELRDEIGRFVPDFQFALDDLTRISEESLQRRTMAALGRLTLFCLQRIRSGGDLRAALAPWANAMRAVLAAPSGADALVGVLSYIMQVGDLPAVELRQFLATEVDPEAETKMTSTWEQIKEEGRVEGRAEGRADILIRQLTARFGELEPAGLDTIRRASGEQLIEWAERVLEAGSLADVLERRG